MKSQYNDATAVQTAQSHIPFLTRSLSLIEEGPANPQNSYGTVAYTHLSSVAAIIKMVA